MTPPDNLCQEPAEHAVGSKILHTSTLVTLQQINLNKPEPTSDITII
jgi:hypothetical protein